MHSEIPAAQTKDALLKREAPYAVIYFAAYLLYLFVHLENEFLHWFSLVLLPLALVSMHRHWRHDEPALANALASVGLRRGNLTSGLLVAALVGFGLSVAQLLLSRNRDQIGEFIFSGKAFYMFPLALGVMLLTAGFTEEFFFRGFLQTRLCSALRSNLWAVVLTSILFGLYHLPFAYCNPRWPSHGNWTEAVQLSFGQGIPAGLVLGWIYVRSRSNLLASVLTHALINSLPAMLQIRIGR